MKQKFQLEKENQYLLSKPFAIKDSLKFFRAHLECENKTQI